MHKPKIQSILPQLPVLDFEASKHFYIVVLDCILAAEYDNLLQKYQAK